MVRPVEWLPVRLGVFEGPLDLLLHLIEDNELDIYDIPIARVTEQYVEYLRAMEEFNLEIASEFILMAATLMEIKARMLLPKPKVEGPEPAEPDPRQALVDMLVEYKRVKEEANVLREMQNAQSSRFCRMASMPAPATAGQLELGDIRLYDLTRQFKQLLDRQRPAFSRIVRESFSVRQKMKELLTALGRGSRAGAVVFSRFVSSAVSRREIVVTFLALLELIRRRSVRAEQDSLFGEVRIFKGRETRKTER